jgi:glutathione S-transferase
MSGTMKLYSSPGSCSLSPHIVLRELGQDFQLVKMDARTHQTESGADYYALNPKGSVPALELDDGQVLTEGAVIVQYLADKKPEAKLAPPQGTMERYRLMEWLNFIATDVHRGFSPLFNPKATDEFKKSIVERLGKRFDFVSARLEKQPFLMGASFSVADAYLFTILRWTKRFEIDLSKWKPLQAFMDRMAARPAVQAALKAEGL